MTGGTAALAGTGRIARMILRRDRVRMSVWTLSLAAFVAYFAVALSTVFDDEALAARAAVMRTPSGIVMGGPGYGLDHYTPTVALANEGITWIVLALSLMGIVHIIRHTRAEEESGRAEAVRSGAVGAMAPALAALATLALQLAVIVVLGAAAAMAGEGARLADALAMMAGSALAALAIALAALVIAQLVTTGSAAIGLSLAVLAVLFMARAAGDMMRLEGSALSWSSPFAWAQQMRPFVELRWWPALLSIAACAVLLLLAAALARRRDLGQGMLAARAGRARAGAGLRGPLTLAWRLQRGALGWSALGLGLLWFATGMMMASLEDMAADLIGDDPVMAALFGGDPSQFTTGFLAVMMRFLVLCAMVVAVAVTLRACRSEEASGRLELVLAAPLSRLRWFASQLLVTGLGASAVLAVSVLGLWAGSVLVGVDDPSLGQYAAALLGHLPAVLVLWGLSAALIGLRPRLGVLAWAVLAATAALDMFGALADLPGWMLALTPLHWTPEPFVAGESLGGVALLCALTVLGVLLGAAGLRRRGIQAES